MSSTQTAAERENLETKLVTRTELMVINQELYPSPAYTNVNEARRRELLEILERLDDVKIFLEYNQPLVILDKSTGPMQYFSDHLIQELGHDPEKARKWEIEAPHYGHHTVKERRPIVGLQLKDLLVIGRVKGADSLVEKMAKIYKKEDPTEELHDIYGFKLICKTAEDVEKVRRRLYAMQDLHVADEEEVDRPSGYKAVHIDTVWNNGNELLNGSQIELQLKTMEQAKHDAKDHANYAQRRLADNGHADLSKFQIIVYDNRAQYGGPWLIETETHKVAKITGNKFAEYWLVVEKGGAQPDPMERLKNTSQLLCLVEQKW